MYKKLKKVQYENSRDAESSKITKETTKTTLVSEIYLFGNNKESLSNKV